MAGHDDDAWAEHQRKRWMRPDAWRWLDPNRERWFPPGHPALDPQNAPELKYRADQPRVPAGNPDGGQWTGEIASPRSPIYFRNRRARAPVGSADSAPRFVPDRDAIKIETEGASRDWDERHKVTLADGSTTVFQNSGSSQAILDSEGRTLSKTLWTPDGPEQQEFVQLVGGGRSLAVLPERLNAALAYYSWLSTRNTPALQAVLSFRAEAFLPGASVDQAAIHVRSLPREEMEEPCPRYAEVQSITNEFARAIDRGAYERAQDYGTAVHKRVKDIINGPETTPRSPPRDPNFRAEVSVLKSSQVNYGKRGSIRVDVFENPGTGTICIYNVKTGREGLGFARS